MLPKFLKLTCGEYINLNKIISIHVHRPVDRPIVVKVWFEPDNRLEKYTDKDAEILIKFLEENALEVPDD